MSRHDWLVLGVFLPVAVFLGVPLLFLAGWMVYFMLWCAWQVWAAIWGAIF